MPVRSYFYSESLGTSTNATTTDATKVTLTFTPEASSTYVYIWSCDVNGSSISYDTIVTLFNNAGTSLATTNVEVADVTDWMTVSGIAFETFGSSPTSQSVTLKFKIENTMTSSIRNARIVAIKLTAADAYVENTSDQSTTSTTLQTAATLTFTPATTGSYLILGSCETKGNSSVNGSVKSQLTYNATAYSESTILPNDATNYFSGIMQANVGSLTNTSKTVTLQWGTNVSGTTNCRNARILALRLDEFTSSTITTETAGSTSNSLTYTNKVTSGTLNTIQGKNYLVIGNAIAQGSTGSSTSYSSGYGINVNGTYITESFIESSLTSGYYGTSRFGALTVITAPTTITANIDYYAENTLVSTGISQATVSVLMLDSITSGNMLMVFL